MIAYRSCIRKLRPGSPEMGKADALILEHGPVYGPLPSTQGLVYGWVDANGDVLAVVEARDTGATRHISNVVVTPRYRGYGLGGYVLRRACLRSPGRVVTYAHNTNVASMMMLLRGGFMPTSVDEQNFVSFKKLAPRGRTRRVSGSSKGRR